MRRGGTLLALLVGSAIALTTSATAAAETVPAMCEREVAVDYAEPLLAMPGLAPPPEGELPYGPHNFGIHRIDATQVLLDGRLFGYRFAGKNAPGRVLDLRWRATATLREVDAAGRVKRVVDARRWQVREASDLNRLQLGFVASHPGFLRIDLRIERLNGHRLGSYRDYFRVLRRSIDLAIGVSSAMVHPGEAVYAQLENLGASRLNTRAFLALEREVGGDWVEVPQPDDPSAVSGGNWLVDSGELMRCQRYEVPADAGPGRYRFVTSVQVAVPEGRPLVRQVFGRFDVVR